MRKPTEARLRLAGEAWLKNAQSTDEFLVGGDSSGGQHPFPCILPPVFFVSLRFDLLR